ncbi:MAG: DUF465 domain-containing protein [Rhodospirillales bacterium]|nr:DUF465 domain-containing protein [Rhodospirillales bacterium]
MNLDDQIETLKSKHQALETAIDRENNRPQPDDGAIADLKKRKLRIKDELEQIRH